MRRKMPDLVVRPQKAQRFSVGERTRVGSRNGSRLAQQGSQIGWFQE
jgi:hypothetical protein